MYVLHVFMEVKKHVFFMFCIYKSMFLASVVYDKTPNPEVWHRRI